MAVICCEECHVGILTSMDDLADALRRFPLPRGETRREFDFERLPIGVRGRLFISSGNFVSITTYPDIASVGIVLEGFILTDKYLIEVQNFLNEFYGPKESYIN